MSSRMATFAVILKCCAMDSTSNCAERVRSLWEFTELANCSTQCPSEYAILSVCRTTSWCRSNALNKRDEVALCTLRAWAISVTVACCRPLIIQRMLSARSTDWLELMFHTFEIYLSILLRCACQPD